MTPEQFEKYAQLMAKYRISRFVQDGGYMLEMSPLGFQMPEVEQERLTQPIGAEKGCPTDDELLLWSAGGQLPDIKTEAPKEP